MLSVSCSSAPWCPHCDHKLRVLSPLHSLSQKQARVLRLLYVSFQVGVMLGIHGWVFSWVGSSSIVAVAIQTSPLPPDATFTAFLAHLLLLCVPLDTKKRPEVQAQSFRSLCSRLLVAGTLCMFLFAPLLHEVAVGNWNPHPVLEIVIDSVSLRGCVYAFQSCGHSPNGHLQCVYQVEQLKQRMYLLHGFPPCQPCFSGSVTRFLCSCSSDIACSGGTFSTAFEWTSAGPGTATILTMYSSPCLFDAVGSIFI